MVMPSVPRHAAQPSSPCATKGWAKATPGVTAKHTAGPCKKPKKAIQSP